MMLMSAFTDPMATSALDPLPALENYIVAAQQLHTSEWQVALARQAHPTAAALGLDQDLVDGMEEIDSVPARIDYLKRQIAKVGHRLVWRAVLLLRTVE